MCRMLILMQEMRLLDSLYSIILVSQKCGFYMSNFKSCYHSCLTKKFFVPRFNNAENHKHIIQYLERPPESTTMTLLQFQRRYVTSTSPPHPYPKSKTAMVGCKTVSLYITEFFFQHTLLNTLFSSFNELLPPSFEDIPPILHFGGEGPAQTKILTMSSCYLRGDNGNATALHSCHNHKENYNMA